jgi:hypothetical protein
LHVVCLPVLLRGDASTELSITGHWPCLWELRSCSEPHGTAAADQTDRGDEKGCTDDRPDHRKSADDDQFGQAQLARKEPAQQGADESDRDRHQTTSVAVAGDGLTDRSADAGNEKQDQKIN